MRRTNIIDWRRFDCSVYKHGMKRVGGAVCEIKVRQLKSANRTRSDSGSQRQSAAVRCGQMRSNGGSRIMSNSASRNRLNSAS